MLIIRCLSCNKVLGEVEGKAKIKCKMAGCHKMNVIDTDEGSQFIFTPLEVPEEHEHLFSGVKDKENIMNRLTK